MCMTWKRAAALSFVWVVAACGGSEGKSSWVDECGGCSNMPSSRCYCGYLPSGTGGSPSAFDSAPSGDGHATSGSGGTPWAGDAASSGGAASTDASGPALCGIAQHVAACVEYAAHLCSLCDPGGCTESQTCYALGNCDSLYEKCSAYFSCALAATTCAESQACTPCQL